MAIKIKRLSAIALLLPLSGYCADLDISKTSPQVLLVIDPLVERQEYGLALTRLKEANVSDEAKRSWLLRHAEEGHVPLQYELAVLLYPISPDESLRWYARGRLARTLDAAECISDTASLGARVALDQRAAVVRDAGIANPKAFQRAINDALAWNDKRKVYPATKWICGETNPPSAAGAIKPEGERRDARASALQNMRLAAQMVTDFERAAAAGDAVAYKVVDSGVFPVSGGRKSWAGWLDNRRLLFAGVSPTNSPGEFSIGAQLNYAILLWDTVRNETQVVVQAQWIGELCVDVDQVVIEVYEGDIRNQIHWVIEGRFPNLGQRRRGESESNFVNPQQDCRRWPPPPPGLKSGEVAWLRSGDGYLIRRDNGNAVEANDYPRAILHRTDKKEISLPMTARGAQVIAYAKWKSAYLLHGETRAPGSTMFRPPHMQGPLGDEAVLYWLYPDGQTESVVAPYGVWNRAYTSTFAPTKRGLIRAGGDSTNDSTPGFAGLYLFENVSRVKRLIAGPVEVGAVSPDGCRVAFAHAPNRLPPQNIVIGGRPAFTLKMIDVCQEH